VGVVDDYGVAVGGPHGGRGAGFSPHLRCCAYPSAVVAAFDEAARVEADERGYVGAFEGPCAQGDSGEGGGASSCLCVTVEQDADSLKLTTVNRNGSDMLVAVREVWAVTVGRFLPRARATWGL
jgi:hypothetical protein